MSHNITVQGGTSVRLPTAGKYCDRDILITAEGGAEDLDTELTEQEALVEELKSVLRGKASGGFDPDLEDAFIMRTLTAYSNSRVQTVGTRAFSHCASLEYVDFPEVTTLGTQAFNSCTSLKRLVLPKLTTIISGDNLTYCYALEYVDFGFAKNIPTWCVANDRSLTTLILRKKDGICTLTNVNAISGTLIESGTGYIYVPRTLADGTDGVAAYQGASNWSTYASQIRAIEDYPEITGG